MKKLLVVAALAGFSVCCLYAQTFGEVTGRVTDPSGAVIPGASVALTNVNTNAVRNAVTAEAGAYTFTSIPPGFYRLRTELPGFKAAVSEPFEVQVQQVVRLDVVLQVGQVSETVEVAATADLLQAETASVGAVVENKIITELPLNGRQYLNLVAMAPITAPCSNSSVMMPWTLSRTHSPASIPRNHLSSGMTTASSWTGQCVYPSSTTGTTSYSSWPTTRRSAAGRTS